MKIVFITFFIFTIVKFESLALESDSEQSEHNYVKFEGVDREQKGMEGVIELRVQGAGWGGSCRFHSQDCQSQCQRGQRNCRNSAGQIICTCYNSLASESDSEQSQDNHLKLEGIDREQKEIEGVSELRVEGGGWGGSCRFHWQSQCQSQCQRGQRYCRNSAGQIICTCQNSLASESDSEQSQYNHLKLEGVDREQKGIEGVSELRVKGWGWGGSCRFHSQDCQSQCQRQRYCRNSDGEIICTCRNWYR